MKLVALDITKRHVKLTGLTPLMFDRYPGDNKTTLDVADKMYFTPGTKKLVIPALNVRSFLSAKNTTSVAKHIGGKQYKALSDALLSFTQITPLDIPICRNGEQIEFHGFIDGIDDQAKIHVEHHVARLDKGIPNPKERPVIELPWEIEFDISLFKNKDVDEQLLLRAFQVGGLSLGLGTFRGSYGKFQVTTWGAIE